MFQSIRNFLTGTTDAERRIEADVKAHLAVTKELIEARFEIKRDLPDVETRIRRLIKHAVAAKESNAPELYQKARALIGAGLEQRRAAQSSLLKLDLLEKEWAIMRDVLKAGEGLRGVTPAQPIDLAKEYIGNRERLTEITAGKSHKDFIRKIREVKDDHRKRFGR